MSKYENGKIYKIVSKNTEQCYVGSTCATLKIRLGKHIQDFNRDSGVTSKHILKFGDYDIILIENHSCATREELENKERFYIESMNCVNKVIPGRSYKEWYQDNKESILEYQKDNATAISEYKKGWYQDNKEALKEAAKQYRQNFKEKYTCQCGGKFTHLNRGQHKKSKKHIKFINNIE